MAQGQGLDVKGGTRGRLGGLIADSFVSNDDTAWRIVWPSFFRSLCSPEHDVSSAIRAKEGKNGEERTLVRRRGTVLCGVISERIDLIRLLLVLGSLIVARGDDLFFSALLGFRRGCARGRRRNVRLDLLATAPDGSLCGGRRSGLALGPTGAALGGRLGGCCGTGAGASGVLLGMARPLRGRPAWRGLLFVFDVQLQGLVDCVCPDNGRGDRRRKGRG